MKDRIRTKCCQVSAAALNAAGAISIGTGLVWEYAAPGPASDFLCGFGFGLLVVGGVRLVFQRLGSKTARTEQES